MRPKKDSKAVLEGLFHGHIRNIKGKAQGYPDALSLLKVVKYFKEKGYQVSLALNANPAEKAGGKLKYYLAA